MQQFRFGKSVSDVAEERSAERAVAIVIIYIRAIANEALRMQRTCVTSCPE